MPPIITKAQKRQAGERGAAARVLVCDLSGAIVAPHLQDEHRKDEYTEILLRELEPQLKRNYDVIALCEQRGWSKPLQLHFLAWADSSYRPVVRELFGSFKTLRNS